MRLRGQTRRLSAGTRVALAIIGGVTVGVILFATVSYVMVTRQLAGDLDSALRQEVDAYRAAVSAGISQDAGGDGQTDQEQGLINASQVYFQARDNPEKSDAGLSDAESSDSNRRAILLVKPVDGPPISTSGIGLASLDINQTRLETYRGEGVVYDDVVLGGEEYRVATASLRDETTNEVVGVFQAALSKEDMQTAAEDWPYAMIIAGLSVIAAAVLFSRWIAATALRPLRAAARTAGGITYSSLSERVDYAGPADEVSLLVDSLNRMLDRLEAAFAEQRRFIADASHEMRTPLTIARGHLDVMRSDGDLNEEQEATLELVTEELQRTSNLVSDLLSLARLEVGNPPPFTALDLSEVVEEAIARAQGLGPRRFFLDYSGPLLVFGNRDLLLQTLLNLLGNAVAHTEEEGRIDVSCRPVGRLAVVEVADDGPGIRPEDLDRVFDRFYRAPNRPRRPEGSGGSGLGLAIARRLAELHQGDLSARNRNGSGAAFTLRLPLLRD